MRNSCVVISCSSQRVSRPAPAAGAVILLAGAPTHWQACRQPSRQRGAPGLVLNRRACSAFPAPGLLPPQAARPPPLATRPARPTIPRRRTGRLRRILFHRFLPATFPIRISLASFPTVRPPFRPARRLPIIGKRPSKIFQSLELFHPRFSNHWNFPRSRTTNTEHPQLNSDPTTHAPHPGGGMPASAASFPSSMTRSGDLAALHPGE